MHLDKHHGRFGLPTCLVLYNIDVYVALRGRVLQSRGSLPDANGFLLFTRTPDVFSGFMNVSSVVESCTSYLSGVNWTPNAALWNCTPPCLSVWYEESFRIMEDLPLQLKEPCAGQRAVFARYWFFWVGSGASILAAVNAGGKCCLVIGAWPIAAGSSEMLFVQVFAAGLDKFWMSMV